MPLDSPDLRSPTAPVLPDDMMSGDYHQRMNEFMTQAALVGMKDDSRNVYDYLSVYRPNFITDGEGRVWEVLSRQVGTDGYVPPFKVRKRQNSSGVWQVYVQPGVIINSWASYLPVAPTVAGSVNTEASPYYLTVGSGTNTLWARTVITPVASEVAEDSWEITGAATVSEWNIGFFDTSDAQGAQINPSTGAAIQNGIYYYPIAAVIYSSGSVTVTQYAFGPWSAKFCQADLTILPGPVANVTVTITP